MTFVFLLSLIAASFTLGKCAPIPIPNNDAIKYNRLGGQTRNNGKPEEQHGLQHLVPKVDEDGILREARIILPKTNNDGVSLEQVRKQLEDKLLTNFGGFTRFDGLGSRLYNNQIYEEAIWIYDVAIYNVEENVEKLEQIAIWLKDAAQQHSIYLRFPGGRVAFI